MTKSRMLRKNISGIQLGMVSVISRVSSDIPVYIPTMYLSGIVLKVPQHAWGPCQKVFNIIQSIYTGLKCTAQPSLRTFQKPCSIWSQYLSSHTNSIVQTTSGCNTDEGSISHRLFRFCTPFALDCPHRLISHKIFTASPFSTSKYFCSWSLGSTPLMFHHSFPPWNKYSP